MHIALVVDPERLLTDAAAVQRLAVALAGDGVRIRRILPIRIASRSPVVDWR